MGVHRSVPLFTTLLTLTAAALGLRLQLRHDVKSHQAAQDASAPELKPRQDQVRNGAAGGIQSISSKPAILPIAIPTPTDTVSPMVLSPSESFGQTSPPPADLPTPTGEIDDYNFPSSIAQVPLATICSDTPASSAHVSLIPVSAFVNATALPPTGSSNLNFASNPSTIPPIPLPSAIDNATSPNKPAAAIANPTARILVDSNGCQTIYSPSYTAVCHTTVRLIGIPDATVTDCDQFITFSSDTRACGGATPFLASNASLATSDVLTRNVDADSDSRANIQTAPPDALPMTSLVLPTITPPPGTYYAAHWYDVARGGVPSNVRVEECDDPHGPIAQSPSIPPGQCVTHSELWTVSQVTELETTESVAGFSGPAALTVGTVTITTTVSFSSTVTLTTTTVVPTVVKRRFDAPMSSSMVLGQSQNPSSTAAAEQEGEEAQQQPMLTVTLQLEPLTHTQVTVEVTKTETRTHVVYETRTMM